MPTMNNHQSSQITKMLLIGETGGGKTGALASLANAGYKLRILDFDNGLDVLKNYVKPAYLENIVYETLTDKLKGLGGKIIPVGAPQAFNIAMGLLDKWSRGGIDLGPVSSWTSNDVLVVDSLTFMSRAILRHVLFLNGRIGQDTRIQDWGAAMEITENLLGLLYSTEVPCNVIVTSHITYIERDDGLNKGYPSALGNKLPPKIGRYFNSTLLVKAKGSGSNVSRVIRTTTDGGIDLKSPVKVPDELPLDTGLADFFKAMRGTGAPPTAPITQEGVKANG